MTAASELRVTDDASREDEMRRVLIVEDEGIIAMDVEQRLIGMGYQVAGIAASGDRALALARQSRPDLILMDVMIKGAEDGIQTAQRILAELDVPIVFLTAYGDANTLNRAKGSMPYGYLTKPFRPADLRSTIEVALHKHAMDRRVRESEHWLTKTLKCIADGVVATDTDGRVRLVNPVAESMLAVIELDVLGRPVEEVFRLDVDEASGATSDLVAQALGRGVQTPLVSGVLPGGGGQTQPVFVDAGAAPIVDDDGRILGAVLVFRDVSKSRLAEHELARHREHLEQLVRERTRELEQARDEAERASRAKSDFLSTMSHELRTPMNAIVGFSQLLESSPLDAGDAESVRYIRDAGTHLMLLIEDLLDMSRIEAGRLAVEVEPTALSGVCENIAPMVAPLLEKYQVTLHQGDSGALMVMADPARLGQVMLNLVSNAIKYNRPGGRVDVAYERLGDDRVRLLVTDTGVGITEEQQALLFRAFERLGQESNKIEGTGLGLAFSKRLVELMHGEIGVSSTPGQGSTFWVVLPLAPEG